MIKHHLYKIRKVITKADLILIFILISSSVLSFIHSNRNPNNAEVLIYIHNELFDRVELTTQRQIIEIETGITLEIKDRKIRLTSSTCREQFCVKQGWTKSLPIICVPNELLITIKSKKKEKDPLLITS